jgi:N-carbamoyl-L-amino-acid hydrolase
MIHAPLGPNGPQDQGWKQLRINGDRLNKHLKDLSQFGRIPEGGVNRIAFSPADIEGRGFTVQLMRNAQLEVHIDPAGNIIGRREGSQTNLPPILFGSHIDSVPEGGNYDGDLGTMAAIEAAQTLAETAYHNRHPLEVVVWCDEEGGLTGSRAITGILAEEELVGLGRDGVSLGEKIQRVGGEPDRITDAVRGRGDVAAYVELHVEQGRILYDQGIQVGVVEGIVGIHQYDVTIEGFANHAGTTPMNIRKNAMLTAAEIVLTVDRVVKSKPGRQVGTVGRLIVEPGAPNVVPGLVSLTVELRDLDSAKIEGLWAEIRTEIDQLAQKYETPTHYELAHTNDPALSDPQIRELIAAAADDLELSSLHMPSGAGHDAQTLAMICPMGMIFVPSVEGISHSPKEFTDPEDVVNGGNVLLQTVVRLDQA